MRRTPHFDRNRHSKGFEGCLDPKDRNRRVRRSRIFFNWELTLALLLL
jgi:hypothetical protein